MTREPVLAIRPGRTRCCHPGRMKADPPEPAYQYRELRELLLGHRPPDCSVAEVAEALGPSLLSYITAASWRDVQAHVDGAKSLSVRGAEALDTALQFASYALDLRRESASNDDRPPGPRESAYEVWTGLFADRATDTELGFADALRRHAGGELPAVHPPKDELGRLILDHARANLGAFLIRRPAGERTNLWRFSRAGRLAQDREDALCTAISADSVLSGFFPRLTDVTSSSRQYLDSSGRGGAVQVVFLPELVVRTAARRAGWPDALEPEPYLELVLAVLAEMRLLLSGEVAEVPAWVLLTGLDVPDDFVLTTELGELRAAPPPLMTAPGSTVDPRLRLSVTYPLSVDLGARRSRARVERVLEAQREFRRRIDHLRLAVLLALRRRDPIALQVAGQEISSPLSHGPSISWPVFVAPFSTALNLGEERLIARWSRTIARRHHPSIELAAQRALLAATAGRDPADRLVDSVIALENLVGQGAGTGPGKAFERAVPVLLADAKSRRASMRVRARAIYTARSDIVHGRREIPVLELEALRGEALVMALNGLRRLFRRFPKRIPDRRRARWLAAQAP